MTDTMTGQDFKAIQTTILELNSFRDLTEFRRALPGVMLRLIPADYFLWNELMISTMSVVDFSESKEGWFRSFTERIKPVFSEHPFNAEFLSNPDPAPLMFSDFYTLEEFKQTRLYKEVHAHNSCWLRQLTVPVHLHPGLISSLNFGRQEQEQDFSERDRAALNFIKPHFKQAYQNAEAATAQTTAASRSLIQFQLTTREAEIGYWLAEGKSNPEIGAIIGISPRTVEKHLENILQKLGAENRTTAAILISHTQQKGDRPVSK